MTATHLPALNRTSPTGAVVRVYRLDPPLHGHAHVAVSAVNAPYTGPETYIFPCDEAGAITSFGELEGSYRGGLDHAEALSGAGCTIVEG